jgi:hypothetical protein
MATITKATPVDVHLKLTAASAKIFKDRASSSGQDLESFLGEVLEKQAHRHALAELLAPLRREFAESGMSEDELDQLVETAREARHQEKHGTPSKVA